MLDLARGNLTSLGRKVLFNFLAQLLGRLFGFYLSWLIQTRVGILQIDAFLLRRFNLFRDQLALIFGTLFSHLNLLPVLFFNCHCL